MGKNRQRFFDTALHLRRLVFAACVIA